MTDELLRPLPVSIMACTGLRPFQSTSDTYRSSSNLSLFSLRSVSASPSLSFTGLAATSIHVSSPFPLRTVARLLHDRCHPNTRRPSIFLPCNSNSNPLDAIVCFSSLFIRPLIFCMCAIGEIRGTYTAANLRERW